MPILKKKKVEQDELTSLAESLPFSTIVLPEFKKASHEPGSVRQPRRFAPPDASMLAVGRFLMERGTVDLLGPDQTLALFKEIHWCCFQIQKLARKKFSTEKEQKAAMIQARRMVSRIEAAEEELFIANRRLVVNCVKPYFWIGQVWLSDFLQEGSRALCNAIRKFDFTRGTPFYSYSQKSIQNRLRNFFRDHVRSGSFGIRPSRDMQLVKSVLETWRRDYNEEPTDEVLAKIVDLPLEKVAKLRAYVKQWESMPSPPISLDTIINEDGGSLYEVIEDTGAREASSGAEQSEIWAAIEKLPERARYIMKLRFLDGRTLEETGSLLKLTRARIKQIQDASLKKLRALLGARMKPKP